MAEKVDVTKFVEVLTKHLVQNEISFWVKKGDSETLCVEFNYVESSGAYTFYGEFEGKPIVKAKVNFQI